MMKVLALVALTGYVAANELSVDRVVDDKVLLFAIQDEVAQLQSELLSANTGRILASNSLLAAKGMEAAAARIDGLVSSNEMAKATVQAMKVAVVETGASLKKNADDLDKSNAKVIASLYTQYQSEVKATTDAVAKLKNTALLMSKLESDKAALAATQKKLEVLIVANAAKTIKGLSDAVASKATNGLHIWSGGPKRTHQGGGWHDMEYDREEFNTAAPYFKKDSNTRFKILIQGVYLFHYTWMSYSGHNHRHAYFYIQGKKINGQFHHYVNSWHTHEMTYTWPIKANSQVWVKVYAGNHAWHGSNDINAHDRIKVQYVGTIDKQKCQASSNANACGHY